MNTRNPDAPNLVTSAPFILFHLACGLVLVTGVSPGLVGLAVGSYFLRMFFVTAGYHRYFSHRAFQTSRAFQFVLAFMAQTSCQKGVLWWAAHHRHHHRFSDQVEDIHSPARRGFWWSHVGWILSPRYDRTPPESVKDLRRYPELVWLNEHHLVPVLAYHVALLALGGLPALVWGGVVSTVVLWHGTFTINSLSHVFGRRRYLTTDTSRNNWLLAVITCGEGWHNNHHFHQNTANQGWFWWEIDATYAALKVLRFFGVVSHLRAPSEATRRAHLEYSDAQRAELASQGGFFRLRLPKQTESMGLPTGQAGS